MVNSTLALLLLVIFSFVTGRLLQRFKYQLFLIPTFSYLLFGILIGPEWGVGVLSKATLIDLRPLVSLLIGLVGFLIGLRIKDLKFHPKVLGVVTSTVIVFYILMAGLVMLLVASLYQPQTGDLLWSGSIEVFSKVWEWNIWTGHLMVALTIAVLAVSSSTLLIRRSLQLLRSTGGVSNLLLTFSSHLQVFAILLYGAVLAYSRSVSGGTDVAPQLLQWILTGVLSGLFCGWLFTLFIGRESDNDRLFLAILGVVTFASGVGAILGLSAIFVNFILGATVALFSKHHEQIQTTLIQLQDPIFVLLLILGGCYWVPAEGWQWSLPLLYFGLRYLLFYLLFSRSLNWLSGKSFTLPHFSEGLMAQGLLVIAIALSFSFRFPDWSHLILTTALGGIFINDILSVRLLRKILLDAGEVSPYINERQVT